LPGLPIDDRPMNAATTVTVSDTLLGDDVKDRLIDAVSWIPVYFLNRKEQFQSPHEFDLHWYYPIAYSADPNTADVEGEVHALDEALQPIAECWNLVKSQFQTPVRLYECVVTANAF